jgi:hypothetical protein
MSKLFEVTVDGARVTLHADHVKGASDADGRAKVFDGSEFHSFDQTYEEFVQLWGKAVDGVNAQTGHPLDCCCPYCLQLRNK